MYAGGKPTTIQDADAYLWRVVYGGDKTGPKHNKLDTENCECSNVFCVAYREATRVWDSKPRKDDKLFWAFLKDVELSFGIWRETEQNALSRLWDYLKGKVMHYTPKIIAALFTLLVLMGLVGATMFLTGWQPTAESTPTVDIEGIQMTIEGNCLTPLHNNAQLAMEDASYFEDIYANLDTCQEVAAFYDEVYVR